MGSSDKGKIELIKLFFRHNDSAQVTAGLFNELHPETNVSAADVLHLVANFNVTGYVGNKTGA